MTGEARAEMTERAALFAATLLAGVIVGVIPTAMMAAAVALWHRAARHHKKNSPRFRRRLHLAPGS